MTLVNLLFDGLRNQRRRCGYKEEVFKDLKPSNMYLIGCGRQCPSMIHQYCSSSVFHRSLPVDDKLLVIDDKKDKTKRIRRKRYDEKIRLDVRCLPKYGKSCAQKILAVSLRRFNCQPYTDIFCILSGAMPASG